MLYSAHGGTRNEIYTAEEQLSVSRIKLNVIS